ncbi:uncharacterized protein CANTADRAFT_29841, partial [Suhomyces tanzawaensis NRRL Y-17324]
NDAQRVLLVIMAFVFPPLPVFILKEYHVFNKETLIVVLLTLLGHIPGIIFALWYSLVEFPKANGQRDGYVRIDEESGPTGPISVSADDDDTVGSETGKQVAATRYTDNPGSSSAQGDGDDVAPPDYEDIAGSSNLAPLADSKRGGDHKVQ